MKAIIFSGALEKGPLSTSMIITNYFAKKLSESGIQSQVFNLADSGIPLFDMSISKIPESVVLMNRLFQEADIHFWLAPLYHGSIPGAMKNSLDWLEVSSKESLPYLTDKTVGMVCWADGSLAIQGINTMDTVARALRAWPIPYSVPIIRNALYDKNGEAELSPEYKKKLDLLIHLAISRKIEVIDISKSYN